MRIFGSLIILWAIIVSIGCQTNFEAGESPVESTPDLGEAPLSTPTPVSTSEGDSMTSTPDISGMENLIEKAKNNLAQRLSVSISEINLVDAKAVTWPNASLGCPQEGMFYAEVLTPGYLILLSTGGMEYEYHAGRSMEVFYCENPTPPVPGLPGDVLRNGTGWRKSASRFSNLSNEYELYYGFTVTIVGLGNPAVPL
jgi:hypothetical protein